VVFFKTMRDANTMKGRGVVLTTTNKARLDEVLGEDSRALEVMGKPRDLQQIDAAVTRRRAGPKPSGIEADLRRRCKKSRLISSFLPEFL
jgi:hypothetical protein